MNHHIHLTSLPIEIPFSTEMLKKIPPSALNPFGFYPSKPSTSSASTQTEANDEEEPANTSEPVVYQNNDPAWHEVTTCHGINDMVMSRSVVRVLN